ncbi:uncharacterized protein ASCRUDRAFT_81126 [Ascoidea rubescens DSM 1968]|uniref:Uncharacterized protein n=1 Tax=Ascoidea rubescens DSM 1968 TaxID=1344418 RepID=A0A1D2VGY6_9ASCO|nr:hypothetical protein ASCRUDRAFT_81126 [Ascoidea rubescens DSM 1968]ODV60753.1 hypothetical protein ASCRUDRAFT_81126 [Ascoidea rubescens DSM 1968]
MSFFSNIKKKRKKKNISETRSAFSEVFGATPSQQAFFSPQPINLLNAFQSQAGI